MSFITRFALREERGRSLKVAITFAMCLLSLLAVRGGSAVAIQSKVEGEPFGVVGELRGSSGVALDFNADGRRIVTADERFCRVWDSMTLKPLSPALDHGDVITTASIDQRGTTVLTCGASKEVRDHGGFLRGTGAKLWRVNTGKLIRSIPSQGKGYLVWYAALRSDGTQVVTCAAGDSAACVWDVLTGKLLMSLATGREVQFVMYNPDGSRVLTFASRTAIARQWDATTGRPIGGDLPSNADRYRGVISPARYSANGKVLVLADSNQLYVYDTRGNVEIASIRDDGLPSRLTFTSVDASADGRLLAAAALGYGNRVWNARNGEPVTELLGNAGSGEAALSPDGKYVGFGGTDETNAGIWDVATDRIIQRLPHVGWFSRVRFSSDGNIMALASKSQNLTCLLRRAESIRRTP